MSSRYSLADAAKIGVALAVGVSTLGYLWLLRGGTEEAQISPRRSQDRGAGGSARGDDKADGNEKTVWCYFGSQSGTAEGFAKELAEESANNDIKLVVEDLENFEPDTFLQHKVVVLVVATYGEGDPTDNAVEFFKWLNDDSLPADSFAGMKFAVMGLGNRQYVNFNSCSRNADERMEALGASRVYQRGEGDDDQNIEEDFEQWKEGGLWPALRAAVGVSNAQEAHDSAPALEEADEVLAKLQLRLIVDGERSASKSAPDPLVQVGGACVLGKWYFNSFVAPIVRCDELRQVRDEEAGKTTKHIDVCTKHLPALSWKTADNLEILPRNPEEVVHWFAERLNAKAKLPSSCSFVRALGVDKAVRKPFPSPCTVQTALELYCDLCTAPARGPARKLAAFVKDPKDREVVFALIQDRETYQWLTGEGARLSLREFFELYLTSADIDLGTFLQLCPRQRSRPYTIASSSREDPHKIGICVSLVQDDNVLSMQALLEGLASRGHPVPHAGERTEVKAHTRRFRGSCSGMLCTRSAVGDRLMIAARPSSFRLPKRTTTPIVMIGAGTGIAPFRGFVREFIAEKGVRARTTLFFGCTKSTEDFVYREELQEAVKMQPPALKDLITAFSREQKEKVYVQHRLNERAEEVKGILADGGYFYVCGSVNMGKAIREELIMVLGGEASGKLQLDRLVKDGRFVEELW